MIIKYKFVNRFNILIYFFIILFLEKKEKQNYERIKKISFFLFNIVFNFLSKFVIKCN